MDAEIDRAQKGAKNTAEAESRVSNVVRKILANDDLEGAGEGEKPPPGQFADPAKQFNR